MKVRTFLSLRTGRILVLSLQRVTAHSQCVCGKGEESQVRSRRVERLEEVKEGQLGDVPTKEKR